MNVLTQLSEMNKNSADHSLLQSVQCSVTELQGPWPRHERYFMGLDMHWYSDGIDRNKILYKIFLLIQVLQRYA